MAMAAPETCYIDLLHEDIIAKIISCLSEPSLPLHVSYGAMSSPTVASIIIIGH